VDVFLAYCYVDDPLAVDLTDSLSRQGLDVGDPLSLWPGQHWLPQIDQGLVHARFAVVLVSQDFLRLSLPQKELDGLANRRRVLSVLAGVGELEVSRHSPRLAVAALPWSERLVRLIRGGA
jgi:hypothetical protein